MACSINKTVVIGLLQIERTARKTTAQPKTDNLLHCWKSYVMSLYSFQDNNGNATTVNSERYIELKNTFFVPELKQKRMFIRNLCFQQDSVTAHTARSSMNVLHPLFVTTSFPDMLRFSAISVS